MTDDDDDDISVEVSPAVVALTRANVIGHIARSLALSVGVPESTRAQVLEGFKTRALMAVTFIMYDATDEICGHLEVAVDWDKYSVELRQGEVGAAFQIDPKQPVTGQISVALGKVEEYIKSVSTGLQAARVNVHFNGVTGAPYEAFKKKHNLSTVPKAELIKKQAWDASVQMSYSPQELSELSILFRHREVGHRASE